jgi:D-glucuronyl C5-epimerase-like protein
MHALLAAFILATAASAPAATAERAELVDADGVVYRYFPGQGYQFHPLANFARLNALVSQRRPVAARRLAGALVARGIPRHGALYWEYCFSFGGASRWTSGFAQAVAAQSLARAGELLGDPSLSRAAYRAFRAITESFLRPLGGGMWIIEYSFSDMAILNAQLQSLVSLDGYAALTDALDVHRTVARLDVAARTLLPQFDTGCWSRYSLGGADADLHYHAYHVQLLRHLAATRPHPTWKRTGDRWNRFLRNRAQRCAQR